MLENSGVIYRKLSQFPKEKEVYTCCLTLLGQIFGGWAEANAGNLVETGGYGLEGYLVGMVIVLKVRCWSKVGLLLWRLYFSLCFHEFYKKANLTIRSAFC